MRIPDPRLQEVLDPLTTAWNSRPPLLDAAVLAPVFTRDGQDWLLYTKRQDDLDVHAGEISFPGGTREGGEHALGCALRETEEEIGIAAADIEVLGRLPERSTHGHCVHVFVGRIAAPDSLTLDIREVAGLVTIPFAELRREERWEFRDMTSRRRRYNVPFFAHEGEMLWGLTGVLTRDLLARIG